MQRDYLLFGNTETERMMSTLTFYYVQLRTRPVVHPPAFFVRPGAVHPICSCTDAHAYQLYAGLWFKLICITLHWIIRIREAKDITA